MGWPSDRLANPSTNKNILRFQKQDRIHCNYSKESMCFNDLLMHLTEENEGTRSFERVGNVYKTATRGAPCFIFPMTAA